MNAISSYRGNRHTKETPTHTHTHTHTHTQTGPITIHCATKLSAQCKYDIKTVINCREHSWVLANTKELKVFFSIKQAARVENRSIVPLT